MGNTLEKLVCLVKSEISASTIVNSQHAEKLLIGFLILTGRNNIENYYFFLFEKANTRVPILSFKKETSVYSIVFIFSNFIYFLSSFLQQLSKFFYRL